MSIDDILGVALLIAGICLPFFLISRHIKWEQDENWRDRGGGGGGIDAGYGGSDF